MCNLCYFIHASYFKRTNSSSCVDFVFFFFNNSSLFFQIEASGHSREKVLVFFKLHPTVITEDNLHQSLLVSSMLDSPINTLYQAVRQVFAPVLLKVSPPQCIQESDRCMPQTQSIYFLYLWFQTIRISKEKNGAYLKQMIVNQFYISIMMINIAQADDESI